MEQQWTVEMVDDIVERVRDGRDSGLMRAPDAMLEAVPFDVAVAYGAWDGHDRSAMAHGLLHALSKWREMLALPPGATITDAPVGSSYVNAGESVVEHVTMTRADFERALRVARRETYEHAMAVLESLAGGVE